MHTDAKFGLIVGIILVIVVAVVFFSNEPAVSGPSVKTAEAKAPPANPSAAAMLPPAGAEPAAQQTSKMPHLR
jgi:hypothetical protein